MEGVDETITIIVVRQLLENSRDEELTTTIDDRIQRAAETVSYVNVVVFKHCLGSTLRMFDKVLINLDDKLLIC